MGPQNASKSDRQLYGGGTYSPSKRANAAVSSATTDKQVVGEKSIGTTETGSGNGPTTEKMPKQNVGGSTPNPKQQAGARYNQPGGSSVNDEKA